eukprot:CAMPEP_0179188164 /NCGR_PEP_ID=MMETSP0796-20121207/93383_1 /TAXON_ID=73915 /ORGANISM="Pyrodinium bahamense, Strain pbaha01" /LENGTH=209 /DNA_ID=CAMNT_0020892255 /DNA_START=121 /DNA_END=749 /DNA_ORIENTATION=+
MPERAPPARCWACPPWPRIPGALTATEQRLAAAEGGRCAVPACLIVPEVRCAGGVRQHEVAHAAQLNGPRHPARPEAEGTRDLAAAQDHKGVAAAEASEAYQAACSETGVAQGEPVPVPAVLAVAAAAGMVGLPVLWPRAPPDEVKPIKHRPELVRGAQACQPSEPSLRAPLEWQVPGGQSSAALGGAWPTISPRCAHTSPLAQRSASE